MVASPWVIVLLYQTIPRCYNLIISGQRIDNLRNINKEIMLNISSEYEKITGGTQNA